MTEEADRVKQAEKLLNDYQIAQGAFNYAMRDWQLAQDDALEHIVEKIKELDEQVTRLLLLNRTHGIS